MAFAGGQLDLRDAYVHPEVENALYVVTAKQEVLTATSLLQPQDLTEDMLPEAGYFYDAADLADEAEPQTDTYQSEVPAHDRITFSTLRSRMGWRALEELRGNLKRILDKAYRWFPSFKRFLNMERECLQYGFNEEQTNKLLHGQNINYSGWLHSNEYRRNVLVDNVTAQVIRNEKRNLFLEINHIPITQWFREQIGLSQKETQRKGNRL